MIELSRFISASKSSLSVGSGPDQGSNDRYADMIICPTITSSLDPNLY